jgi:acetoin utilization protein AcuB
MKKTAEDVLKEIQSISVDEYATPCSITAESGTSVGSVVEMMKTNGIRHVPVLDNGNPIGIISSRDVANIHEGAELNAGEIMAEELYAVVAGTLLSDVVYEMSSKKIGSALVLDSGDQSLSIFTSIDALNALNEVLRGEIL